MHIKDLSSKKDHHGAGRIATLLENTGRLKRRWKKKRY